MKTLFKLTVFFLLSCQSHNYEELNGKWRVDSPYYKATYVIHHEDAKQKCEVFRYDDGTSSYHKRAESPYYLFEKVYHKNGQLYGVDGLSGATVMSDRYLLDLVSDDTMQVTSYINDRQIKENWIRIKN